MGKGISTWVSMPYCYIIQQKQEHSVGTDREILTLLSLKYIMLLMSMVIISLIFTVIDTSLLWITTINTNTTMPRLSFKLLELQLLLQQHIMVSIRRKILNNKHEYYNLRVLCYYKQTHMFG